jgi:hypothetical protein
MGFALKRGALPRCGRRRLSSECHGWRRGHRRSAAAALRSGRVGGVEGCGCAPAAAVAGLPWGGWGWRLQPGGGGPNPARAAARPWGDPQALDVLPRLRWRGFRRAGRGGSGSRGMESVRVLPRLRWAGIAGAGIVLQEEKKGASCVHEFCVRGCAVVAFWLSRLMVVLLCF